jgi:UDP-3-O-[3-hydroxymyristoyl] glucosamine N-acyltransferase
VTVTIAELADLIHASVHGDPDLLIAAARPLHSAGPDDLTFIEHERNARFLESCVARAVVVPVAIAETRAELASDGHPPPTLLAVADPLLAFVAIVQKLHGLPSLPVHGIDRRAVVDPDADVGPDASIHANVVIGAGTVIGARCRIHPGVCIGRNCVIGDDVTLYPNVVLYDSTKVGNRVIVHANAVLGADGFGYRFQEGRHVKVPQFGSVEIGDDVEIGACSTIDRGTFNATRVGAGTKIDNLVMVGHNCQLGRHNIIVSQVGIAGSCTTGDYVVMAGQVGIADHVNIGDRATIGARAGLFRDVASGESMLGAPAKPEREAKRMLLCLEQLPSLFREVRELQRKVLKDDPEPPQAKAS